MPGNSDLTEAQVRESSPPSATGKWGRMISSVRSTTSPRRSGHRPRRSFAKGSLSPCRCPWPPDQVRITQRGDAPHAPDRCGGETEMVPLPYSADYFAISPHGIANTHLDALCHYSIRQDVQRLFGHRRDLRGARNGAIDALRDGSFHAGADRCAPRQRREWLEPGEAISPADLEAANRPEASGGRRRRAVRPYGSARTGEGEGTAGFVQRRPGRTRCGLPAVAARRKVAALGSDGRVTSCLAASRRSCRSTRSRSSPWCPSTRQLRPGRAR